MDNDYYSELVEQIQKEIFSKTYSKIMPSDFSSSTYGTWMGRQIDQEIMDEVFGISPKVKYKEDSVEGNWHTVKIYDRAVRNWLKEQELHLWSMNNDGSYDVHSSLWIMLCLAWEE